MFNSRLYLDFDGVLNAKEPQHELISNFDIASNNNKLFAKINNMTFSPTVIERLDHFRENYAVELVWLSSWNDRKDVLKLPAFLEGLHGGRVLEANLNHEAKDRHEWTQWKADAIIYDQKIDPKRFIWVDDNAHRFHGDAVAMETTAVSNLFVTPESLWGLTTENLDAMEDFFRIK